MYIWYTTLAILLSTYKNITKIDGNLTKFGPKQFVQFFVRHGVHGIGL